MSTAIQRRGRPGLATLIEKFPLILFLALLVWLSVQSPYFLSWQNISLMLVQSVPLAILCFGLVCVIAVGGDDVVSGGIDLSLPATAVLGVALLSLGWPNGTRRISCCWRCWRRFACCAGRSMACWCWRPACRRCWPPSRPRWRLPV
ncbi:hypothetical protein KPZU09_30500 [Klebsiella pneumoniae]|uniref:Transmembrane sugar transport protein n=1 Tax=Klebsiella pneumoniae TaxID=573 RepID=A0A919HW49_KLEPN|nr:hypothetical protein KPZU09_30500 [Klebsiella pneumoniae]